MLEMYAPEKLKLSCKVIKWSGGFMVYGVAHSIDYVSQGLEKKCFGTPIPINSPQLMELFQQKMIF